LKNGALMIVEEPLHDTTDEELMLDIAKGNKDAFQVLAKRHMNFIYSVAFRMFPQKTDAEDIVQEVLIRIWNKADMWKQDTGATVSTWIYRITYNLCIDQKRRVKRNMDQLNIDIIDPGIAADNKLNNKQSRIVIIASLQRLPKRQRAALVLCHYQGLSNAEAAAVIGTSVKAVESLLIRARKSLRQDLQKYKGVL